MGNEPDRGGALTRGIESVIDTKDLVGSLINGSEAEEALLDVELETVTEGVG